MVFFFFHEVSVSSTDGDDKDTSIEPFFTYGPGDEDQESTSRHQPCETQQLREAAPCFIDVPDPPEKEMGVRTIPFKTGQSGVSEGVRIEQGPGKTYPVQGEKNRELDAVEVMPTREKTMGGDDEVGTDLPSKDDREEVVLYVPEKKVEISKNWEAVGAGGEYEYRSDARGMQQSVDESEIEIRNDEVQLQDEPRYQNEGEASHKDVGTVTEVVEKSVADLNTDRRRSSGKVDRKVSSMRCEPTFVSVGVQTDRLEQRHAKTQTQVEQRSKRTQTTAPAVAVEGSGAECSFRRVDKKGGSKGKKNIKDVEKKSRKNSRFKACSHGPTSTSAPGGTSIPTEVAVRPKKKVSWTPCDTAQGKTKNDTVVGKKMNAFHPSLGGSIGNKFRQKNLGKKRKRRTDADELNSRKKSKEGADTKESPYASTEAITEAQKRPKRRRSTGEGVCPGLARTGKKKARKVDVNMQEFLAKTFGGSLGVVKPQAKNRKRILRRKGGDLVVKRHGKREEK